MNTKSILDYETVELLPEENAVQIIDQTLLPGETKLIRLRTAKEIWDAIYLLQVRGAPAIGVAAAFGIYILTNAVEILMVIRTSSRWKIIYNVGKIFWK